MPRPRANVPKYLHHTASATAYVRLLRPDGTRQTISLGKFDSPESLAAYKKVLDGTHPALTGQPSPPVRTVPQAAPAPVLAPTRTTVNEVCLAYLTKHAQHHYRRPDGRPTQEYDAMKAVVRLLREEDGTVVAAAFGPLRLKSLREKLIDRGLCRRVVNQRVMRIKRIFKWAASEELVPGSAYQALAAVEGLRTGRSRAKDLPPVKPVAWATVLKTIKHLNPIVRAMVLVQWHTGMREQDVCNLRPCDLDTQGVVWVFRPASHKTEHHGHERVIFLGKKAQAALKPWLVGVAPTAYVFSPKRATALANAKKRKARKTKVQPSQQDRKKTDSKRQPGAKYLTSSYDHAVAVAREKAGLARWTLHQLRHSFGTRARENYGVEAAQVAMGHATMSAAQIYAERDLSQARIIAEQMG